MTSKLFILERDTSDETYMFLILKRHKNILKGMFYAQHRKSTLP